MTKLEPCPFCGCQLGRHIDTRAFGFVGIEHELVFGNTVFFHPYVDCVLDGFVINANNSEKWNRRANNEKAVYIVD